MVVRAPNNNNKNNAILPTTMLMPTTTRITLKKTTTRRMSGGRMAATAIAAATADQRICRPATPLILNDAGTAVVIVFVNNNGILLFKSPMASVVHVSAGQKEEAPAGIS